MARRMPRLRLLIVAAAVPLLLWGVLPVLSQGQGLQGRIDKKRAQIDAKKGRERVLTSDITSLSHQIGALQSQITTLQSRQVRLESDLAAKREELARIQERLRQERIRLAKLRARLAESRTVLAARLVALYKAGQPDIVMVILKSDGFAQMLERTEFIQRIGEQDKRIIDAVRAAKAQSAATAKRLDGLEARQQRITAAGGREARRGRGGQDAGHLDAGSSTRPCANRAGASSRTCAPTARAWRATSRRWRPSRSRSARGSPPPRPRRRRRRRRPRPSRCTRARAG